MPSRDRESVEVVRIVLASPGDVVAEREIVGKVIDDLNNDYAIPERGVYLDLYQWETDSAPGFDIGGPQGSIDRSLRIDEADLLIGIFWTRFGKSMGHEASGTFHEFTLAYESWKEKGYPDIKVYFKQRAYNPNPEELTQWTRVKEFQEKFPPHGFWWSYRGRTEFDRKLRSHLTKFLHGLNTVRRPLPPPKTAVHYGRLPAPESGLRIATGVSKAFWCNPTSKNKPFQPAWLEIGERPRQQVDWFDELLHGGLVFPKNATRPLTMLIAGPPGSGKSTLAMEICYRLASTQARSSLYISMEAEANALIENARDLGYQHIKTYMRQLGDDNGQLGGAVVTVSGITSDTLRKGMAEVAKQAVEALDEKMRGAALPNHPVEYRKEIPAENPGAAPSQVFRPPILVIDSLNVFDDEGQGEVFEEFLIKRLAGTQMVIFVLDSHSAAEGHKYWEYQSDIVVRVDHSTGQDYYLRTIEIVKARFQGHVSGKHQLKIYE